MTLRFKFGLLAIAVLVIGAVYLSSRPSEIRRIGKPLKTIWLKAIHTSEWDEPKVEPDGHGNFYVAGYLEGSVFGRNRGGQDAYVAKYDEGGNLIWGRQLGDDAKEYHTRVAVDGRGQVFVAFCSDSGSSWLTGVEILSPDGRTAGGFKVPGLFVSDAALGPHGRLHMLANTHTVMVYDGHGKLVRRIPATPAFGRAVTTRFLHDTSIVVDGQENEYVGGIDLDSGLQGYVFKISPAGTVLWGQGGIPVTRLRIDGKGNVCAVGHLQFEELESRRPGMLNKAIAWYRNLRARRMQSAFGESDGLAAVFTAGGRKKWSRQTNMKGADRINAVRFSSGGDIYVVVGWAVDLGSQDRKNYVVKFDRDGNEMWTRPIPLPVGSRTGDIAIVDGFIYICGTRPTGDPTKRQAFLMKLAE